MKNCPTCNCEKDESEFNIDRNRKGGFSYDCKICNRIRTQKHLEKHREKNKERSRLFYENNKEHCQEVKREYYEKNRKIFIKRARDWSIDPIKKERKRIRARAYKKKQIELAKAHKLINADYKKRQISAHLKVYWAVKKGRLIKPEICEKCGEKKDLQGHHEDYKKPLKVMWLCFICHCKQHNKYMDLT
jgi:hypothetical protein